MASGVCDRYCERCIYRGYWSGSNGHYCRYLDETDKRRPCPTGTGCTVRVTRKVNRKKKKEELAE